MSTARVSEILTRYGEDASTATWKVQGTTVIYHSALERIAAQAKIGFDLPQILRSEKDEAVILVVGRLGDRTEWSIGEALVNVNYRISGRQAAYVYAMAEKRAKDRVILKLVGLHGLIYSEEEADELRQRDEAPQRQEPPARPLERSPVERGSSDDGRTQADDDCDEMIDALNRRAGTGVDAFLAHPRVKPVYDGFNANLKARVDAAAAKRRLIAPKEVA